MTSFIELNAVVKKYNINTTAEVHALRGINLKVDKSELVAVTGPSGSGKSTLLHIIGCLDRVTEGLLYIDSKKVNEISDYELAYIRNKRIGFVLQEYGLILERTSVENVAIPLMFSKIKLKNIKQKSMEMLKTVGMDDYANKKTNQLSGGQKQRVAIARALVNDPDIILADELTGALDQTTSSEIINILLELNKMGKTVILITHNIEIAQRCPRVIHIRDGLIEKENQK